jgi:hypothetical protein
LFPISDIICQVSTNKMGILISTETCCLLTLSYLITGPLISRGNLVSFTNKTDRHNITEILLKVVLNTITLTPYSIFFTNAIFFYIYISNQISTTFDKIKILYFFNVSTHFFFNYYCLTTYGWLVLWSLTPVLLVMETRVPWENQRSAWCDWDWTIKHQVCFLQYKQTEILLRHGTKIINDKVD